MMGKYLMRPISNLLTLYRGCIGAFKFLLSNYSNAKYELTSIEYKSYMVTYSDASRKSSFSKHITEILNNESLIYSFSSCDLAQIGFLYGKWVQFANKEETN